MVEGNHHCPVVLDAGTVVYRCDGCSVGCRTFPVDEVHKHWPQQFVLPPHFTASAPLDEEVQHVWVQWDVVLETEVTEDALSDNASGLLGGLDMGRKVVYNGSSEIWCCVCR